MCKTDLMKNCCPEGDKGRFLRPFTKAVLISVNRSLKTWWSSNAPIKAEQHVTGRYISQVCTYIIARLAYDKGEVEALQVCTPLVTCMCNRQAGNERRHPCNGQKNAHILLGCRCIHSEIYRPRLSSPIFGVALRINLTHTLRSCRVTAC